MPRKVKTSRGMIQSMSRLSRCNNGPMESFSIMMKSEMYYLNKFNTYEELQVAVKKYIHYYNTHRYQKRLTCNNAFGIQTIPYQFSSVHSYTFYQKNL